MKRRLGTNMMLILAFALLAALSQWASYQVSSDLLRITVRDGDRVVYAYEPMMSPLVQKRFAAMQVFYE